jgi:cytochrome c biogenesis factor
MEVSKAFVPEKVNIIDRFSNISRGRMFYNSIICVGCGTALMVNLMRNDVTLAKALSYEDMDVSLLFFSSILIALACLVLLVIQMHLIVSKGYKKAAVRKVVQKRRV